ncbi:putative competence/damage-inducible CinA family protein [Aulographum hederae CBS 113979]|uniref:Putative competence/damage-inducible CinA family protein n=1 Tax=Aulographum hederae CBS 113979 TaxID=1176131 RepID=A0A6G1GRX5_9PEZI|nr:putative competence/damage-inducible CinA family protein [Aulographum hederae CBS 113979]
MATLWTSSDFPPQGVREIVGEVAHLLKERGESIAVAETCAGGIISSSILSTPGASAIYYGGLTLYTLPSRIAFAGWTEETVKSYSGPTPEIVAGLAENVRDKLHASYTICESGTAGPTGGEARNRTPGYVALACATKEGKTYTREVETGLGPDREANMVRFSVEALTLVRDVIKGDAKL